MDEREAELRQAIADAPDDIGARLVYADFLQERGDLRGEHIALACAQDGETETAEMRRRALWQHHGAAWMAADLGATPDAVEYRNGFPHAVRATLMQLVELGDQLTRQPLRKLSVRMPPIDNDAVAASPVLPRVRELDLGNRFDDADATTRILAAATRVTHLALRLLHGSRNVDAIWQSLERYERFDQLEHFELEWIPLSAERARWLAARLTRVKSLRLTSSTDAESIVALAERMPELEHLYIQQRRAGDDAVFAKALAGAWTRKLKSLALVGCPLGAKAAVQLSRLPPTLTDLELSGVDASVAVAGLANCAFPALTKLELYKSAPSSTHVERALRFPTLRSLHLTHTIANARLIAERAPELTEVTVDEVVLEDGIAALVALPLRELRLWCEIDAAGIDTLVQLRGLRELSVTACGIEKELPRLAAAAFDKMARLFVLEISEAVARREFGEAWIITGRDHDTFERRLELAGAPVPYSRADPSKSVVLEGRMFDPTAEYEIDDKVAHPDYGIGSVTHVEPIRIDVDFPQHGVVKFPLRPARARAYDPTWAGAYQIGDILDHPMHGICIVVLRQPNKLFVRLASGADATIVPQPSLLDRLRGLLR
jgi:uncharacterized protein (TIGR02996 family)